MENTEKFLLTGKLPRTSTSVTKFITLKSKIELLPWMTSSLHFSNTLNLITNKENKVNVEVEEMTQIIVTVTVNKQNDITV